MIDIVYMQECILIHNTYLPLDLSLAKISLKLFHQILPHSPHPRPLTKHIHGNSKKQTSQLNTSKRQKNLLGPIRFQPPIEKQRKDQSVENIFRKVECDQSFTSVLAIRVYGKGDGGGGTYATAETDDAEEDGGHDPGVVFGDAPAVAHEADDGGDCNGDGHDEAEFGLVDAVVAAGHPSYNYI
jgi:hypothetical protein